jgi:hypothetical protein
MNTLLRTLLLFGSLVLITVIPTHAGAGCVDETGSVAKVGGIGGTGNPAAKDGGIGGTGSVADNGGIGGTGSPTKDGGIGGTGIIGTITGFASICVNGLEVHYDGATRVSINGATGDASMLAVGQVVAMDAENSPQGLHAQSVAVLHALEGPVTGISREPGVVLVMGRTVRTAVSTKLDGFLNLGDLRPGSMVRVSGYKNARGEVVASRIQLAPGLREESAIGIVASDLHDRFALDGLPVSNVAVAPKSGGGEALVRGNWNGKELVARKVLLDPSLPFAGRVERVVAEGLIVGAAAERLNLGGFEVDMRGASKISGGNRDELVEGQRVRITGKIENGRHIKAERVELVRHGNGIDDERSSRQSHQKQEPMDPSARPDNAMKSEEPGMPTARMPADEQANPVDSMEGSERSGPMGLSGGIGGMGGSQMGRGGRR